jgi:hypothetical protein
MADDEREATRAEGYDPDNPDVRVAIDLVRRELELLARSFYVGNDLADS